MRPYEVKKLGIATFDSPPKKLTRVPKDFGLDKSKARLPIANESTVNLSLIHI